MYVSRRQKSQQRDGNVRKIFLMSSLTLVAFIVSLAGPVGVQAQTAGLKKAKVAVPIVGVSSIPTFVAKDLGYYRDEGFDTEIILMRAAATIQALISDSVDYTGTPGATIAAAVQGAKLLVLMAYFDKPLYDLVVRPEISSYAELKGKIFGVAALSGFAYEIPRVMLSRNGLDPKRDVTMMLIGTTQDRMLALKANGVQATVLDPPYNFLAVREGLRKLDSSVPYFQTLFGALTTSERKIKSVPDDVRRFVRATARGYLAYRNHREISLPIIQRVLKLDQKLAEQVYDYSRTVMPTDATIPEELMRTVIETQRESSGVTRPVASEEVFNFSFVRAAMKELGGR
jgi:ABC-type nitrate/sulfonate/bicarbonate transport system substrate-binding protein